jgi:hypothetical protein
MNIATLLLIAQLKLQVLYLEQELAAMTATTTAAVATTTATTTPVWPAKIYEPPCPASSTIEAWNAALAKGGVPWDMQHDGLTTSQDAYCGIEIPADLLTVPVGVGQ